LESADHAPPAHPQFPRVRAVYCCVWAEAVRAVLTPVAAQIVAELQEQKLNDEEINAIVLKLKSTKRFNTEELLFARTTGLGHDQLSDMCTRLGQHEEDAICLATAIQKIRPPAEPERRLSPRDAGIEPQPEIPLPNIVQQALAAAGATSDGEHVLRCIVAAAG